MSLPILTVGVLALVAAAFVATPSAFLRGRLRFAAILLILAGALEIALERHLGDAAVVSGLARLFLVAGGIVAVVAVLVNPWKQNRASDRVPAIVQDFIVIGLFAIAATLLLDEKLMTTSAVGAVVVGFALQDTLGNLFSGLAIQIEKPFRVGQWIRVGEFEGKVQEVTWRATKLLTKSGQLVILPNSLMSKDAILNFSEPVIPTRIEVEVGASYDAPPNLVKQALGEALDNAPMVLRDPAPDVVMADFAASSITYRVRFWIDDFGRDARARDQVRSNIWYTFKRFGIEIPFPIQVQYERENPPAQRAGRAEELAEQLGRVDLFADFTDADRLQLATTCREHLFGAGERIVKQGDPGQSMFVVLDGQVRIILEPSGQEVATTSAGGFFGEMSMLTGDPRTATVRAIGDATLLEIDADRFRELAVQRPGLVDRVGSIVAARRIGLAEAHAAADDSHARTAASHTLLSRIKAFLKL
ncbi:MAG: mechanosensitive ion channel family protein [Vicinamibacterales bacterium]